MADILQTLPPFVGKTDGVGDILRAVNGELERLEQEARAASLRLSAGTADETGAALWENELGLGHPEQLSPAARRVLIRLALEQMETCTPARLKALLGQMLEGEVTLKESFSDYDLRLALHITDFYVPSLHAVEQALRRTVPAHLDCGLEFSAGLESTGGAKRVLSQSIRMTMVSREETT